jgi:hypothetical protein
MSTVANLRVRRSAAQLHALAGVEREIRANDPNGRRKYLRAFNEAFASYQSVLDLHGVAELARGADILLVGDYHALPASQRFAASLLEQRSLLGDRPVVLGLETVFSRDQHILDEWWRREIGADELRQRIRFQSDWGYDWAPLYELLVTAREHGEAVFGLDCMPREDLRKIGARDRHAAEKLIEIRQRHPRAAILVLFGESHLAPQHLPMALRQRMPQERLLTVLQNVDALYWQAAGEARDRVEAVRVAEDVVCVFNATPLEKYENYRLYLDRWAREDRDGPDMAPTIYNLVDGLVRFLGISHYSPHNTSQPRFLIDLLPEVHCRPSEATLRKLLGRGGASEDEVEAALLRIEERGCAYLAAANAFCIREFQMIYAAEEATRFLHHACRGLPERGIGPQDRPPAAANLFYSRALEHALAYFGSRVLHPARPAVRSEEDGALWRAGSERHMEKMTRTEGDFAAATEVLGYMMGSHLYDRYVRGDVGPSQLRRLFLAHIERPGQAREQWWNLISEKPTGPGNRRKRSS